MTAAHGHGGAGPPTEIGPSHHIAFPEALDVRDVALAPDGGHAYVLTTVEALDCWGLAVSHWPEILGAGAALVALAALLVLRRVRQRPQAAGAPHCRRCNYDLSAHVRPAERPTRRRPFEAPAGAVCPECGVWLARRPPRRGRRVWRRALPAVVPAAAVLAVYAAMLALGLPRDGRATAWVDWSSTRLAERVKKSGWLWLTPWVKRASRIVDVDTATGERRTLTTVSWAMVWDVTVAPDGRALYGATARRTGGGSEMGLARLSLPGGRLTARTVIPDAAPVLPGGPPIVGFWDAGRTVLVQCATETDGLSRVMAWKPAAGTLATLVATDAMVDTSRARRRVWGRTFALRGGAERPRFISLPSFMQSHPSGRMDLRVHSPDGGAERAVELAQRAGPDGDAAVTPDGKLAVLPGRTGGVILVIDLETGEEQPVRLPDLESPWERLTLSSDGRWLLVPVQRGLVLRDMESNTWAARLLHPSDLYAPDAELSADGSRAAALLQRNTGPQAFTHDLVVWHLRERAGSRR